MTDILKYAHELASAGFEVWYHNFGHGYLVYRNPANDCWGTFQRSEFEGWQHLMPIKPSREHGSHMYMEVPGNPWTVIAARECARATNRNALVGMQHNYPASVSTNSVLVNAEDGNA